MQTPLSWISILPPPTLQVSHPLVRSSFKTREDRAQLLQDLVGYCAGQRTLDTVLEESLAEGDFAGAALAVARDTVRGGRVIAAWQVRRQALTEQISAVERACADLVGVQAVQAHLADARTFLGEATRLLPGTDASLTALEALSRDKLKEIWENVVAAEGELANARGALKRQEEERRHQFRELKRIADGILDQLLFDPTADAETAQRVYQMLMSLVRAQRMEEAKGQIEQLQRLARGEAIDLSERLVAASDPPAPVSSPTQPMLLAQPSPLVQQEVGAFLRKDLSAMSRRYLDAPQKVTVTDTGPLEDYPYREWEQPELRRWFVGAKALLARAPEPAHLGAPGGVFLDSRAKLQLLRQDPYQALALFGDLFRWSCHASPDLRWRDNAAWGVLLSLALPYLPEVEQRDCLTPRNLKALFERPIGVFPLLRLRQLGLFSELALWLLRLRRPYGGHFLRSYLVPHLRTTPPAAQELMEGLLSEAIQAPSSALDLVTSLLRDLLPAEAARQIKIDTFGPTARDGEDPADLKRLQTLRERMLPVCDAADLAQIAADSIERIEGKTQRSTAPQVTSSLLTTAVLLQSDGRLVVSLTCPEEGPPLHGLRLDAELTTAKDRRQAPTPEDYIHKALQTPAPLPVLHPGERREIPLVFARTDEQLVSANRLVLSATVHLADGERREVRSAFSSFAVQLTRPLLSAPAWPPHRYVVGKPIDNVSNFKGRRDDVDRICGALIGAAQDNAVLVLGDRKIGKTSLLYAIEREKRIVDRYHWCYLDFENLPSDETAEGFLAEHLMKPMAQKLQPLLGQVPAVDAGAMAQSPTQEFKRFVAACDMALEQKGRRLLLVMDEFERIFEVIALQGSAGAGRLDIAVIAALRSSLQGARRIGLIMAGVTDVLRRNLKSKDDRLFRFAVEVELKSLEEEDARRLITEPVQDQYEFTSLAIERIIAETNRQPYLINQVCLELYQQMKQQRARHATEAEILAVLDNKIVPHPGPFWHLVEPVKEPRYFVLIKAIAALQEGRRYVSLADLLRQLRRNGVDLREDEVTERLQEILQYTKTVIDRQVGTKNHFRLTVGLFARHLRFLQEDRRPFVVRS